MALGERIGRAHRQGGRLAAATSQSAATEMKMPSLEASGGTLRECEGAGYFSSRANRLDVSQRLPPSFSTSE
ncbi:hypothetical protein S58_29440 [Bradyrhizobium oligotrophicum S58]|uniref:Uncharacterized protein n=1 Tax=Bradyrhizobium oligotrophicum S58 TaxID=1245469 RepID=M4ZRT7_9BRAD|nr:hypothetical protein S58_29440 [Bradyrhizobium oligotrophicum S58]